jgi:hypothetical protein
MLVYCKSLDLSLIVSCAMHASDNNTIAVSQKVDVYSPAYHDYSKCDPCCNAACKPGKTCIKGWTCIATVGPPFCAAALVCNMLGAICIPCISLIEKKDEPSCTKSLDFCVPPIPEKEEEREFLHAVCRLPACWPCAHFFGFPDRVMCKDFFCNSCS